MNQKRRKAIAEEEARLTALIEEIDSIKDNLEALRDEEEEYKDNMPESLQYSEKAETSEAAIENLTTVIDALESFSDADLAGTLAEAQS